MTFRTFDIDTGHAAPNAVVTAPARNARSRRLAKALSHRAGGTRIVGFGF